LTARASASPSRQELRTLNRGLAAAEDNKIHRVLEIIDSLADRGEADDLIAPLRARLAELRPRRPLSFARLLFLPLDPLIVATPEWNRDSPAIPRGALTPLARQVQDGLGVAATIITAEAVKHSTHDEITDIASLGSELWARAAEILAAASPPAAWTAQSSLPGRDHAVLAAATSAVLAQASPLLDLVIKARRGAEPDSDGLRACLAAVAQAGVQPLAMMIAMAMEWLPRSELLVSVADDFVRTHDDPTVGATTDRAVDFVLTGIERCPLPSPDLATAASEARRIAGMLADLTQSSAQRPGRQKRIEQARRDIDTAFRERFAKELDTQVSAPAAALADADDHTVASLEASARDIRRFEAAARRIGGAEQYARQLHRVAETLRPGLGDDGAVRAKRLRLVEILEGPDAAMAMLKACPA